MSANVIFQHEYYISVEYFPREVKSSHTKVLSAKKTFSAFPHLRIFRRVRDLAIVFAAPRTPACNAGAMPECIPWDTGLRPPTPIMNMINDKWREYIINIIRMMNEYKK